MKAGWEVKALGDVCEIAPKKALVKKTLTDEQLVSFVPMNQLGELGSHFTAKEDRPLSSVYKGYTYFCDDDVIIAKITPCFENGKMGVASGMTNGVGFGSSEFVPIRGQGKTLPKYLFYYLLRNDFRENGTRVMSGAVGHKRVPKEYIENLPIPLPPLEEQKRIVSILDEAFEGLDRARENAEANLKSARELFDATLQSTLDPKEKIGWGIKSLGEVCALQNGFAFKSKLFKPSGVPVLRISSIQNDSICDNRPVFVDPSDYKENLDKYKVVDDDLLIAMSGATTGKVGFNQTGLTFLLNQRVGKFEPSEKLEKKYLYYYLSTKVQENLEISAGAAQPNLSTQQIKEFQIPLPPLAEQKRIVFQLDKISMEYNSLKVRYATKLQDISDLRQSLLQKAFAGELT